MRDSVGSDLLETDIQDKQQDQNPMISCGSILMDTSRITARSDRIAVRPLNELLMNRSLIRGAKGVWDPAGTHALVGVDGACANITNSIIAGGRAVDIQGFKGTSGCKEHAIINSLMHGTTAVSAVKLINNILTSAVRQPLLTVRAPLSICETPPCALDLPIVDFMVANNLFVPQVSGIDLVQTAFRQEKALPALTDEHLLNNAEEWFGPGGGMNVLEGNLLQSDPDQVFAPGELDPGIANVDPFEPLPGAAHLSAGADPKSSRFNLPMVMQGQLQTDFVGDDRTGEAIGPYAPR